MWQKGPDMEVLSSPDQSLTCKDCLCGLWWDTMFYMTFVSWLLPVKILDLLFVVMIYVFITLIFEQYMILMGKHTSCRHGHKP